MAIEKDVKLVLIQGDDWCELWRQVTISDPYESLSFSHCLASGHNERYVDLGKFLFEALNDLEVTSLTYCKYYPEPNVWGMKDPVSFLSRINPEQKEEWLCFSYTTTFNRC